ncbi:unnamed protein product [Phaeothamnion confervicola]
MDLFVYVSDSAADIADFREDRLLWQQRGLRFGDATAINNNVREAEMNYSAAPALESNGSLWAHIFLTRAGVSPDPSEPSHRAAEVVTFVSQMNRFRLRRAVPKRKRLLDGPDKAAMAAPAAADVAQADGGGGAGAGWPRESEAAAAVKDMVVSYWKPTLAINFVLFWDDIPRNRVPPPLGDHMQFYDVTGDYKPILWVNEFWLQTKHLIEMNTTTAGALPLKLSVAPIANWKWLSMITMEKQTAAMGKVGLGGGDDDGGGGDMDKLREMLAETSPWLLIVTFAVTLLHNVFDILAFKNDVSFWKNKRSLEGLSVRSIGLNCFFQLIILLYLADNDTSWAVLFSHVLGVIIEFWKIGKAFLVSLDWGSPSAPRWLPRLCMAARGGYEKSRTREYDAIATMHLLYVVVPLVTGYAGYSLLHQQHKRWYSWVVSSLVGFVYAFGFVMMTPQLFINYKLRSVAHMPWRVMAYKSLNTFIDDLFAFVIKMPLMHRLACLRDDVVFFVFLYQRWIYKVDPNRVNEYGQRAPGAGDDEDDDDDAGVAMLAAAAEPAAAALTAGSGKEGAGMAVRGGGGGGDGSGGDGSGGSGSGNKEAGLLVGDRAAGSSSDGEGNGAPAEAVVKGTTADAVPASQLLRRKKADIVRPA